MPPKAQPATNPVSRKIVASAREIHTKIVAGRKPSMKFPRQSLANVRYTPKKGYFEMVGRDLNYVMDTYLPAKLKHPEKFLP